MGFLDDLKKNVGQFLGGGEQQNSLMSLAASLLSDRDSGGLAGLADSFKNKGLGDLVSSWIGTGENKAVTADQIQNVLGDERIQQFAEKMGFSREDVSNGLAAVLPKIIDMMTPDGKVPDQGALDEKMTAFKDKLLKG